MTDKRAAVSKLENVRVERDIKLAADLYGQGRFYHAADIYENLSQLGVPECQEFIGWMYYTGLGREQSDTRARHWLEQATAAGLPSAQYRLGILCQKQREFDTAILLFTSASEKNYSPALCRLGLCYEVGRGVEINLDRAFDCYTRAATLGNVVAAHRRALLLIKGYKGLIFRAKGAVAFVLATIRTIHLGFHNSDSEHGLG